MGFQLFFSTAHEGIGHERSKWRTHGNPPVHTDSHGIETVDFWWQFPATLSSVEVVLLVEPIILESFFCLEFEGFIYRYICE